MILLDDSYIAIAEEKFDDDFSQMYDTPHLIYGFNDNAGVVGFEIREDMIWITFLWSDGTFGTLKQLAELMCDVFEVYTVGKDMPILYTGERNRFPNSSKEIISGTWQYVPKQYLM